MSGCSTVSGLWGGGDQAAEGKPGFVTGFLGAVAADEPQAAVVGRQMLAAGGNAADAAVAMTSALWVTLPSRAGIGGGGACLVHRGDGGGKGVPDAVMFLPQAPGSTAGADRPAAVPMMARGMFLLNARFGRARFESILTTAEQMAREGTPASRALVRDLAVVAGPLAADPGARSVFFPGGRLIAEGATMVQPELAGMLGQLRRAGVGDLYSGALAAQFVAAVAQAGGAISPADLRAALPKVMTPLLLDGPNEAAVSFLPLPADGGLAAAAAYRVLAADPAALDAAKARGIAAAAEYRRTGAMAEAILNGNPPTATLPALPASTSFAVLDREGNAVSCALTMGNLFGTGRMAPGTGILLAASPTALPPPLLAAGMVTYRRNNAMRVVAGGAGQDGAPVAVARALAAALADKGKVARLDPAGAPEPGRANVIACNGSAAAPETCAWTTDPRGFGLATGSN